MMKQVVLKENTRLMNMDLLTDLTWNVPAGKCK